MTILQELRGAICVLFIGLTISLAGIILFLGTWFLIFFPGALSSKNQCEARDVLAEASSPDGAWVARFFSNVCAAGMVTDVFDTVEIARPNEPIHPLPDTGVVFGMDDHYDNRPAPRTLKWVAPRQLEITVPNDAWSGKQDSSFADISLSYKYVPDDPIERTCLKRWRSLPTDEMVRRSESQTDNIKAFLAQCHTKHGHTR